MVSTTCTFVAPVLDEEIGGSIFHDSIIFDNAYRCILHHLCER